MNMISSIDVCADTATTIALTYASEYTAEAGLLLAAVANEIVDELHRDSSLESLFEAISLPTQLSNRRRLQPLELSCAFQAAVVHLNRVLTPELSVLCDNLLALCPRAHRTNRHLRERAISLWWAITALTPAYTDAE